MFGLGSGNTKSDEFLFDLEREIQDPKQGRELKELVVSRTKEVKQQLRGGADKDDFDSLGILLHAYTSLQKVIARVMKKKK